MLGGISIWQLLIVLGIIILIFGTKKLRNVGSDLGGAVKGFKGAMKEEEKNTDEPTAQQKVAHEQKRGDTIDVEAESRDTADKRS